jgi:hypothetical protein
MNRLQGSTHLHQNTPLHRGQARGRSTHLNDSEIAAAEARVREQEAHVLRLIVQGAPTQMAEDVLRQLTAAADAVRARKGLAEQQK